MQNNPFYLTFPASLPLMVFFQFFLLRRWFVKQKRYRTIVSEIYLHESGQIIFVNYANTITRKLRNYPLEETFFIPFLKTPELDQYDMPFTGKPFPQTLEELNNWRPFIFDYAWTKYYTNNQNHLMIPMRYDYANTQVLSQVFKGKVIVVD